jgi:hypothetical protein
LRSSIQTRILRNVGPPRLRWGTILAQVISKIGIEACKLLRGWCSSHWALLETTEAWTRHLESNSRTLFKKPENVGGLLGRSRLAEFGRLDGKTPAILEASSTATNGTEGREDWELPVAPHTEELLTRR